MTTENTSVIMIYLLGAMDHLWFQQTILSSEIPSFFLLPENPKTTPTTSESTDYLSESSVIPDQEISPLVSTVISDPHEDENSSSQEESEHDDDDKERPTRLNLATNKTRFNSSSPTSAKKQSRNLKLKKTMSCKSLAELELEELKGFMDLGFNFKKEHLSKHMVSLIPGLQRLGKFKNGEKSENNSEITTSTFEKGIMRPYLSEAWLVKKQFDSPPLMKLSTSIQSVSTSEDMKKHLKYWARTVASAIHQESS